MEYPRDTISKRKIAQKLRDLKDKFPKEGAVSLTKIRCDLNILTVDMATLVRHGVFVNIDGLWMFTYDGPIDDLVDIIRSDRSVVYKSHKERLIKWKEEIDNGAKWSRFKGQCRPPIAKD